MRHVCGTFAARLRHVCGSCEHAEASLHFFAKREMDDQIGGASKKKKSGGPVDPGEQKLYDQIRNLRENLNRLPPGPRPNRSGSDNSWDDATIRKKQNELRKLESPNHK